MAKSFSDFFRLSYKNLKLKGLFVGMKDYS